EMCIRDRIDVRQYGKPGAVYIVNTKTQADWYVPIDATSIALKYGLVVAGWTVVNLIMAAAFAAVSGLISLESIIKAVPEYVPRKYVDANVKAVIEGYEIAKRLVKVG
ncbi:2-oxoacid:acceptor oxidoreductase family protein, partial [Pyrobaculum aerophilum]|uniref:2-oxoacid:acceptor oxidoreductase family protein n=1 Tax=Pyrobaculum aerophilum TaxID=13773 RepID=UPI0023F4D144